MFILPSPIPRLSPGRSSRRALAGEEEGA